MSFTNIIGQDVAVRALKNIIAQNQVNGSFLFLGPDGVGKRTTGIEFAKAVNCEKGQGDACGECISCSKIDSLNHPDVFIIEKEKDSNFIKIEKIREVIYQASLKPYEARIKLFIILNAETMTIEASNSLLKILEEPPQNQIFVLTTSYLSGILPTVLSRCKVLKFGFLSQGQIQEFLVERHNLSHQEAIFFSHIAMGSLGRAVSFKEKDILGQRNQVLNDFFFKKRALFREEAIDEKKYVDIEESIHLLLCWYRDLLISKFTDNKDIFLNLDRCEELFSYSNRFSRDKLQQDLGNIIKTLGYLRSNINSKLALFNMALGLERL